MIVRRQVRPAGADNQHHRCQIETISSGLRILNTKLLALIMAMPDVSKSTLRHFNALYAQNGLPVPTTCVLISAPTLMSGLLSAQFVGKHLHVSTIESVMKVCIRERRNSYAKESSNKVGSGVVVVALHVPMHWVGISVQKLAAFALSRYSMKRP